MTSATAAKPRGPGGRPRKAPLTDDEFRTAIAILQAPPEAPRSGWRDAADEVSLRRIEVWLAAGKTGDTYHLSVSPRWLSRALAERGWRGKTSEADSTPGRKELEGALPGTPGVRQ